jgi:tetratricopeptide (TPR) repeat protein
MMKEQGKKELALEIRNAKEMAASGKVDESFAIFDKLREKYPDDREVAENLEALRKRINNDQYLQTVRNNIMEGLNIYKKGNIRGAIVKWQEGLNFDPENTQLKAYIKSAEEKFRIAENLPGILAEGVEIYKTGKIEEAIEKWREVIKLEPDNTRAKAYIDSANVKLREYKLKKETDSMIKSAQEESAQGNDLEALLLYKQVLNLKPDLREIKDVMERLYQKLTKEDFGSDVEAAIISEAFIRGIDRLLEDDYMSALKEWKKAIEKRPLEKKLKDYSEKVKAILKTRLEELMSDADETYREKRYTETMDSLNKILKIDASNEFALKYMLDVKPMIGEEIQKAYREAMDYYNDNKLEQCRDKLLTVLHMDPDYLAAKKRLEEVNERISKIK